MRRAAILIIAGGAAVALIALLTSSQSSTYRFAALFDTADSIVPGQQVKIAGAVVGSVSNVDLAPGPKARIVMTINPRFAPLHRNATCTILPEGLISENFVACNPGTARTGSLADGSAGLPTVPLVQTTVPASLQDVLNVFSLPTDQRAQGLINELGIATAGRGADINAVLERSNPALTQAQRVLTLVDRQREQLATGIGQTDRVLAVLATRDQGVRRFVDQTAVVAKTTASDPTALAASVRRLPALLSSLRPGLGSLNTAIAQGTPLLASLHDSARQLDEVTQILPSFLTAGTPALVSLGSAARTGLAALPVAAPVVAALRSAATQAGPFSANLDQLLTSIRNGGGLEGILRLFYSWAVGVSAYDQTSHMQTLYLNVFPQCLNQTFARGCDAQYAAPGHGTIPPNDPACGPQDPAPWAPPTSCIALPNIAAIKRHRPARATAPGRTAAPKPPTAPVSRTLKPAGGAQPAGATGATGATGLLAPLVGPLEGVVPAPVAAPIQSLLHFLLGK